jgi:hypothetical protein
VLHSPGHADSVESVADGHGRPLPCLPHITHPSPPSHLSLLPIFEKCCDYSGPDNPEEQKMVLIMALAWALSMAFVVVMTPVTTVTSHCCP